MVSCLKLVDVVRVQLGAPPDVRRLVPGFTTHKTTEKTSVVTATRHSNDSKLDRQKHTNFAKLRVESLHKQSCEDLQVQGYKVFSIGSRKDLAQLATTLTAETADLADVEESLVALKSSHAAGKESCVGGASDLVAL